MLISSYSIQEEKYFSSKIRYSTRNNIHSEATVIKMKNDVIVYSIFYVLFYPHFLIEKISQV